MQDTDITPPAVLARRATQGTSADAYSALGLKAVQGQARAIFDVVLGAQKAGARDMSLREIREAYERRCNKRIDVSSVSARVNNLIAMGWLERRAEVRPCSISNAGVRPVFVPAKQARMFA